VPPDDDPERAEPAPGIPDQMIALNRQSADLRRRSAEALARSRSLRERCSVLSELIGGLLRKRRRSAKPARED